MVNNATCIGKVEMNKSFQKIEISKIETSKEIEKIYDYSNRESEIKTLENSIIEFGQLQPITVVYINGKYLITDGVLRFKAIKNLNLDYIEVIIIQYIETDQTDFTDFIIHNQIKKVKTSKEKLNEIIYTLRIEEIKTNPNRDKNSRVKFLTSYLGKGWSRCNVLSLEKILKWEIDHDKLYFLSENILEDKYSVLRANKYIEFLQREDYNFGKEEESKILKHYLNGDYNETEVNRLIISYNSKKNDTPTSFDFTDYSSEKYLIIQGDVLKNPIPKNIFIDLVFTSIPYYRQVIYGKSKDEIGWEKTPEEFVSKIVDVFSLNNKQFNHSTVFAININETFKDGECLAIIPMLILEFKKRGFIYIQPTGWQKKDNKPAPNNIKRFSSSSESILLFAKSKDYYFNPIKIVNDKKKCEVKTGCKEQGKTTESFHISNQYDSIRDFISEQDMEDIIFLNQSNKRAQKGLNNEFFGSFPTMLPARYILSLCPENGTVWDPFGGMGNTGKMALTLGRSVVINELYEKNVDTLKKVLKMGETEFDKNSLDSLQEDLGLTSEYELLSNVA